MNDLSTLTIEEFFFNVPLYSSITITDNNVEIIEKILKSSETLEGYNSLKQKQTTFNNVTYWGNYSQSLENFKSHGGIKELELKCKRYDTIFSFFILFDTTQNTITKIGQYPSVADLHINEIKKYNKLLGPDKLREFTRAMGLAANGVGIGSFVYLRRIFEFLISKAKDDGIKNSDIDEESFNKLRMDDKIDALKNYLPDFLVENRKMYSILSKGIHKLNEDECLQYFEPLRVGIEIILDEKLDEQKKRSKIAEAKKKISSMLGKEKSK